MDVHEGITTGSDNMTQVNSGDDYYVTVMTPAIVPLVSYAP